MIGFQRSAMFLQGRVLSNPQSNKKQMGLGFGSCSFLCFENFQRKFDNFQFVHANSLITPRMESSKELEAKFVLKALMEIPFQYSFIKNNGLLGKGGRLIPCRAEVAIFDPPDHHGMYPDIPE
jgi:hypothetical protein